MRETAQSDRPDWSCAQRTVRRQLVAGLKGHYELSALVGKLIVVVNNLQPAVLRGVESQGMLLAAQDGDKVVVLSPDQEVSPGSQVL